MAMTYETRMAWQNRMLLVPAFGCTPRFLPFLGADSSDSAENEATRLPVFRTWPAVYAFVVATFVLWVTLLAILARIFS